MSNKDASMAAVTKKLLRRYNIQTRKKLGQHFLIDDAVLEQILDAAALTPEDTVIEVGPGLGLMTRELAKRAGWVIAIELDNRLASLLQDNLEAENIVVINEDVLGTNPAKLMQGSAPHFPPQLRSYKVVANLPYYITSPVLRHFLEASVKPATMVVMVQKEVAEVIAAKAGGRSVLSIAVQFYGKPEIVANVPAASFFPPPEVDSAVLKIDVYDNPPVPVKDVEGFFKLVRAGFTAARKQVANSLAQGLHIDKEAAVRLLAKAGLDPQRRAETFTLEEWANLHNVYSRGKK
ncbi:MAG: 16S rRNA (adenine(1518)-N(6)/adenine(1519)-N(6))-dimethyltransferase RsmA [Dehalococcoidales bacterium]|nr:16S rRNA (adenine(1518)-N(6)/adenine(1519)-N(6))-dimethyltransferase RsmA [Dehalococcoidales bacterium]